MNPSFHRERASKFMFLLKRRFEKKNKLAKNHNKNSEHFKTKGMQIKTGRENKKTKQRMGNLKKISAMTQIMNW